MREVEFPGGWHQVDWPCVYFICIWIGWLNWVGRVWLLAEVQLTSYPFGGFSLGSKDGGLYHPIHMSHFRNLTNHVTIRKCGIICGREFLRCSTTSSSSG